jgi:hypothetical protein
MNSIDLENNNSNNNNENIKFLELQTKINRETENKTFKIRQKKMGHLNIFTLKNTILKEVFKDCIFLLNNSVYFLIIIFNVFNIKHKINIPYISLNIISLSSITGFISFILVFYLSDCYRRYYLHLSEIYKINIYIKELILIIASFVDKNNYNEINKLTNIACSLNIICMLSYIKSGISVYNYDNFLTPINNKYSLITNNELNNYKVLNLNDSINKIMSKLMVEFPNYNGNFYEKAKLVRFYSDISNLIETVNRDIPFIYRNLIYKISTIFLFLLSIYIGLTITQDGNASTVTFIIGAIIVCLTNTLVIGIIKIGDSIYEPYDGDVDDFNVVTVSITNINECIDILYNLFIGNDETDEIDNVPENENLKRIYNLKQSQIKIKST